MVLKTRSPLRYPGGKSRAISQIVDKYIIPNIPKSNKICSPFFGGGSIEIHLAKQGYRVYGYDAFPPLVDFWQVLLKNPNKLANATEKELRVSRKKFDKIQDDFRNKSGKDYHLHIDVSHVSQLFHTEQLLLTTSICGGLFLKIT